MLVSKPNFLRPAQDAVNELARDGITCTPDEILWLQELAEKIIRPTPCDQIRFFDYPVPCGNIVLLPPSIGVKIWLREVAAPWFSHDDKMELLSCAFALAHGRNPSVLYALTDRHSAAKTIMKWAKALTCTYKELENGIKRALNLPDDYVDLKTPKEEKEEKAGVKSRIPAVDYGEIIALLCHYYPQNKEYWLWQASEDNVALAIAKISTIMPQDMKIAGNAEIVAIGMLRLAVKHIKESRKK